MPAVAAGTYGTGGGSGTGGLPYLLPSRFPPSVYLVSPALQAQYRGQYTLGVINQRTRLTSGAIYITTEPDHSLLGLVQFYGYDTLGWQTSWLAVLYNFQPLDHNRISIQLFDTAGQDLQDRMLVSRDSHGNLIGQLQMDGQVYAMSWHKVSSIAR
jgi:hypothetical protein